MKKIICLNGVYSIANISRAGRAKITILAVGRHGNIHSAAYQEIVECVYHGLGDLRYEVGLVSEPAMLEGNVIVIGGHGLRSEEIRFLPPSTVIYNTEHAGSVWVSDPAQSYRKALMRFPVWDYSIDNSRRLAELLGTEVRFVPLGYVPQLTRIANAAQDIDVLFFGSHNDRRKIMFGKLRALGQTVHTVFGVYGGDRDSLMARSKVIINVHQLLPGALEMTRVSYALANGKAIVTERNPGEALDDDLSEAVIAVPYDELAEACRDLVADDRRRKDLERTALLAFSKRNQSVILRDAIGALGGHFVF